MGRKGRQRGKNWRPKTQWVDIKKNNELFESYYKAQKIVPEGEWDDFMAALRRELPSTFRVTGSASHATFLKEIMKVNFLNDLKDVTVDGVKAEPPQNLVWYPNELAWQVNLSRNFIRKSGMVSRFHQFLVEETNQGHICRQEAVSMIPPLLMDIKPNHKVLDVCAAPGSKTAQIIEMLHEGVDEGIPDGLCVANDVQNRRCYLLVHQSKRLHSPVSVVTNLDATLFPSLSTEGDNKDKIPLKFDRVLCDVPCSSDGTMRKNPLLWHKWGTRLGLGLHRLQLKILLRGTELIGVGGRVVYSTCSLNPIEDEAVISAVLQKAQGSLELVDCSSSLKGLKRMPGLHTWKVWARSGKDITDPEESNEGKPDPNKVTMRPPTEEVAKQLHLERCMRVLPHHQDTGGFFIAVLEKKSLLPWEDPKTGLRYYNWNKKLPWEDIRFIRLAQKKQTDKNDNDTKTAEDRATEEAPADDADADEKEEEEGEQEGDKSMEMLENIEGLGSDQENADNEEEENADDSSGPPPAKKSKKMRIYKEDPYFFLESDDPHWPQIRDFYGMLDSFPATQLMVRSQGGQKRNIYLCSKTSQSMVRVAEPENKVINTGVRLFERCTGTDIPCDFRISQEGVYYVAPFVTKRKVYVNQKDIMVLLEEGNPFISKFSEEAQKALNSLGEGCLILVYDMKRRLPEETVITDLYICAWRAKVSVRILLSKQDKIHHLLMCGQVDKCFREEKPNNTKESKKKGTSSKEDPTPIKSDGEVSQPESDVVMETLKNEAELTDKQDSEVDDQVAHMSDPELPAESIDVGFV